MLHPRIALPPAIAGALALLGLSACSDHPPNLEEVPAGEADATKIISDMIVANIHARYDQRPPGTPARRDAHAKAHGCTWAKFTVVDGIAAAQKFGVFAAPKTYPAIIRFSNSDGVPQADSIGDARGMAIKVIGVGGDKVLEEEASAQTQDFITVDHPVFFVRNAADYVEIFKGRPAFLAAHPHEKAIFEAIAAKPAPQNPLSLRYFSMTPYQVGEKAVKFSVAPCAGQVNDGPLSNADNYLAEVLDAQLAQRGSCFDFFIQTQQNATETPVEDPTIEWTEAAAPPVKVATIEIPPQSIDSDEQTAFCENLSYTPWHGGFRPLGGINRIRKVVYTTISKLRHEMNAAPRQEPTPSDAPAFLNL